MNVVLKTTRMASYFWPGFRKAWDHLDQQAAVIAILFAWTAIFAGFNLFYWSQWFPAWLVNATAFLVAFVSVGHGLRTILFGEAASQASLASDSREEIESSFRLAQESYLQASYFEAEQYLLKNLAIDESDIESALLLASVYRRAGKYQDALETLNQLQLKERAVRWESEILVEKEKVVRSKRHSSVVPPPKG